jgi:hypothetical protein
LVNGVLSVFFCRKNTEYNWNLVRGFHEGGYLLPMN